MVHNSYFYGAVKVLNGWRPDNVVASKSPLALRLRGRAERVGAGAGGSAVTTLGTNSGSVVVYAPGATGNIVMEDAAFMLEAMGFDTGIDLESLLDVRRGVE